MTHLLIILSWLIFFYTFYNNYKSYEKYSFFNVTFFVFFFFLVYYSLPTLFNIHFSNNYHDGYRLEKLNITTNENFYISLNIFIGSLGFMFSFLFFKNKIKITKLHFKDKNLIIILLLIIIFLNLLKLLFLNFDVSFTSRAEPYLFARNLSIELRILNKFVNMGILYLELIFLFKIFQYYSSNKKLILVFILIYFLNLYLNFDIHDQRSEIFMQLIIIIISYNLFVNRISFKVMGLIGSILFFVLFSWSIARDGGQFLVISDIKNLGEFDNIYANFIDLHRNKPELIIFKTKFYDFFSFIPSFGLWFEKSPLPIWFLQNYHPSKYSIGAGLGFGILSESVYGYGLLETFFKTFILSLILNYLFQKYLTSKSVYYEIYYIILFINAPLSIRSTSFSFLSEVIQFGILISFSIFILRKLMSFKI